MNGTGKTEKSKRKPSKSMVAQSIHNFNAWLIDTTVYMCLFIGIVMIKSPLTFGLIVCSVIFIVPYISITSQFLLFDVLCEIELWVLVVVGICLIWLMLSELIIQALKEMNLIDYEEKIWP